MVGLASLGYSPTMTSFAPSHSTSPSASQISSLHEPHRGPTHAGQFIQRLPFQTGWGQVYSGPSEQEIANYAYLIWEQEGRPEGREKLHWEHARAQLIACREHDQWLAVWRSLLATGNG